MFRKGQIGALLTWLPSLVIILMVGFILLAVVLSMEIKDLDASEELNAGDLASSSLVSFMNSEVPFQEQVWKMTDLIAYWAVSEDEEAAKIIESEVELFFPERGFEQYTFQINGKNMGSSSRVTVVAD
ncbi:MAG: hypothetical protein ABIE22_04535, partial [archaeon]